MLPLYEKIEELCKENKINITQMCKNANIPRSALSDYKMGRKQSITLPNIKRISAYFNISIDELLGNEQKEKPAEHDILNDVDVAFFGGYKELDEAQRQMLRDMVEVMREKRKKQGE